jgi:hypothetical protein
MTPQTLGIGDALAVGVRDVMRDWTKIKRQADSQQRARERDIERLQLGARRRVTIKTASYHGMSEAYATVSGNGRLPAAARQIMYAARPSVLALCGSIWAQDSYFTQILLPNYLALHPDLDWDVTFDDRGHLAEPHTDHRLGLGTLSVRAYLDAWKAGPPEPVDIWDALSRLWPMPTQGPVGRFQNVLFVEKEGFLPLFESIQLAERFDLGIMSTKGMSVTASRRLVERLSELGVRIFVLHDFDASGFSILHTLRSSTRRYRYTHTPAVTDLGLRLADIQDLGLADEPVTFRQEKDPRAKLREAGASEAECAVLAQRGPHGNWHGRRVELNAMTSPQLQRWLEGKLREHHVEKYVPDADYLRAAWDRLWALSHIAEQLQSTTVESAPEQPVDLRDRLLQQLNGVDGAVDADADSWDRALWELVRMEPES